MELPDLTQLTDEQIKKSEQGFMQIALDESQDIARRKEAKNAALLIASEVDFRREKPSEMSMVANETKRFKQRWLSTLLNIPGFPTDIAVAASDAYLKYSGLAGLLEAAGGEEAPSFGDERYGMPTTENLRRSVQSIGESAGVDILGDYTRPAEGIGERLAEPAAFVLGGQAAIYNLAKNALKKAGGTAIKKSLFDQRGVEIPRGVPTSSAELASKNIVSSFRNQPVRSTAYDLAAIPSMAATRFGLEAAGAPEGVIVAGEMLSGAGPAVLGTLASKAASISPTVQTFKQGVKLVKKGKGLLDPSKADPSKAEGTRAAKVLQEFAENPDRIIKRLEATEGNPNLSIAQRTESDLLTALEAKIIASADGSAKGPGTLAKNREGQETIRKLTETITSKGTSMEDTVKFGKEQIKAFELSIKARLQQASTDLNETLNKLKMSNPDKSAEDISRISSIAIRETIEKALNDVVAQEGKIWRKMPNSVKGSQETLVRTVLAEIDSVGRAQLDDIPEVVKFINTAMYKKNGKLVTYQESVKELKSLHIKLGETARKATVEGELNKARIARDFQDAIETDMNGWTGKGAAVNARIKEAREFSRLKHKYFSKGKVGDILGYKKGVDTKVKPALTAEAVLTGSAARRLENVLDLTAAEKFALTATGKLDDSTIGVLPGLSDNLKSEFLIKAFPEGVFNASGAQSFFRANNRVLSLVPETRVQLMRARDQADVVKRVTKANDAYMNAVSSKADSSLAKLLNYEPDVVIAKILNTDRADKFDQMQTLVNLAKKDKSALEGLKNGVARYIVDQTTKQNATITGRPMINANQMYNRLQDDKGLESAMRLVFNAQEMQSIKFASKQMKMIQDSMARSVNVDFATGVEGTLMENVVGFGAIRAGGEVGGKTGSSLVMAGLFKRLAQKTFRDFNPDRARYLLSQAFKDEKLMKILLKKPITKSKTNIKGKVIAGAKELVVKLTEGESKILKSYLVTPIVPTEDREQFFEERSAVNQEMLDAFLVE